MIGDSVKAALATVTAKDVRFIRLGPGGSWWPVSKQTNTVRLGYHEAAFELCKTHRWTDLLAEFKARGIGKTSGAIRRHVNQIEAFFTLPKTTLWITLAEGDLWWCFADEEVHDLKPRDKAEADKAGARFRPVIGQWSNKDVMGNRLQADTLTTWIVQTQAFQGTISKLQGAEEAIRRIRCEFSETYVALKKAVEDLEVLVSRHLHKLHEDDFELIIELIFSASGWRRVSPVGGEQKTIDMALVLPTTGDKCFVQVKSHTSQAQFQEYLDRFKELTGYSRMFYCYHTLGRGSGGSLSLNGAEGVTVWSAREIARQVIDAGLVNWLLDKTA